MKREIIEDEPARNALNNAEERWSRANDAWESITWAIMNDPDVGLPVTESGKTRVITLHGARSADIPDITVLYEDNPPFLHIRDAKFKDSTKPYVPQLH